MLFVWNNTFTRGHLIWGSFLEVLFYIHYITMVTAKHTEQLAFLKIKFKTSIFSPSSEMYSVRTWMKRQIWWPYNHGFSLQWFQIGIFKFETTGIIITVKSRNWWITLILQIIDMHLCNSNKRLTILTLISAYIEFQGFR